MAQEKSYDNRSLAIADMIRDQLVEHWQKFSNEDIAGTITLVASGRNPSVTGNTERTRTRSVSGCGSKWFGKMPEIPRDVAIGFGFGGLFEIGLVYQFVEQRPGESRRERIAQT